MAVVLEALPPREAIRAFIERGHELHPSFAWEDVYGELHARMFTVAKSAGYDVLEDIHRELLKALEDGRTFRDFAADLKPLLVNRGWWGNVLETDPFTGEDTIVRLGSMYRLRLIFETNMRVSYATGKWNRFERLKSSRPYLRYIAILDARTRPHHAELHNLVLPVEHPFWNTHAPPNGWNCRCTLQSLSERDIEKLKKAGVPLRFDSPPVGRRAWTNKRTGETRQVPIGIDPGWDYNIGNIDASLAAQY